MYDFNPEKPLRLVYGPPRRINLAIWILFTKPFPQELMALQVLNDNYLGLFCFWALFFGRDFPCVPLLTFPRFVRISPFPIFSAPIIVFLDY